MAAAMMGMISNKVAKAKGIKIGVRGTTVQASKMAPMTSKAGKTDQGSGKGSGSPIATGKTIDKNQAGGRMSAGGSVGKEGQPGTDGAKTWPGAGSSIKKGKQQLRNKGKIMPGGGQYGGPNSRP